MLVGADHTPPLALNAMRTAPLDNVTATVINLKKSASYTGVTAGFVTGYRQREELDIDLERLASAVKAK